MLLPELRDLHFDNVPFRVCLLLLQSEPLGGMLFLRKSLTAVAEPAVAHIPPSPST
jgi:hypothetical protein